MTAGGITPGSFSVYSNKSLVNGKERVAVIAYSGIDTFTAPSGSLLNIAVQASANASLGNQPVPFVTSGLSNEDGSVSVSHDRENGTISVTGPSDTTGPSLAITSHTNNQHVSTSSITLSGTASDSGKGDNGIQQVTVNGTPGDNGTATGTGTANWSKVVSLNQGANTITVIAYDNSSNHNQTTQSITIYYDAPDTTGPSLTITSHGNNQHVSTPSITLAGTASDSGKGDNGIQQVTVNGNPANNGTASGSGTANWSKSLTLSGGANAITVIAYDNSSNHNQTTQNITIYYDTPGSDVTGPSLAITSHTNNQHVSTSSVTLSGTASDSGKGDNGIQQVTVNGSPANNGTASGSGTANWSKVVTLSGGANAITVIAYDNSSNHNQTTQSITIYYDAPGGKPFIRVTSPNGGENYVVGSTHTITWDSLHLDPNGTIHLFYWCDNKWHPIAALSPGVTSFQWTIPRSPAEVTSPTPSGKVRSTSIWVGNWVNGKWECSDWSDSSFRILYDAWVCVISGGDRGGATLFFDDADFDGHGVSLELGIYRIEGTYSMDAQGSMSGTYAISDFSNRSHVFYSGNFTGNIDSKSKKLTLALTTPDGNPVFTMAGARLLGDSVIPANWTATLSGSKSGTLTSLVIDPFQFENNTYSYVYEISGSGSIKEAGSINIVGYFYFTSATTSYRGTNVYGIYQITGATNETGVLTGNLNPSSGKFSFTMAEENGNKYKLTGKKITP